MANNEDVFDMGDDDLFEAACPDGDDEMISEGEIVSLLVGGHWLWGNVAVADDDYVTLTDVAVVDTLSTPPRRGGKTATAGVATVRIDDVQAVVRGIFNEWS